MGGKKKENTKSDLPAYNIISVGGHLGAMTNN